jgi:hypothetical protein
MVSGRWEGCQDRFLDRNASFVTVLIVVSVFSSMMIIILVMLMLMIMW